MPDMIDEMLRADEEALKAKKQRLRALEKTIQAARAAVEEARSAVQESMTHDGLSRSDLARTFELSSRERALFVPSRSSTRSGAAEDTAKQSDGRAEVSENTTAESGGGEWSQPHQEAASAAG